MPICAFNYIFNIKGGYVNKKAMINKLLYDFICGSVVNTCLTFVTNQDNKKIASQICRNGDGDLSLYATLALIHVHSFKRSSTPYQDGSLLTHSTQHLVFISVCHVSFFYLARLKQ